MIHMISALPAIHPSTLRRWSGFSICTPKCRQTAQGASSDCFSEMQPKPPTIGRNGEIKTNEKDEGQ